ncbi:Uncharacterized protein M6B38_237305 [Iris pallida]|uniref:Uncharacterized protein n=1 Tax=Iris pallida TaxID=29817 RepID=A0AAX6DLZ9_IRIPA|nr:Uncharacterized protein M6B38_237305 [Iris pallida]
MKLIGNCGGDGGAVDRAVLLLLLAAAVAVQQLGGASAQSKLACTSRRSPCYRRVIRCPPECPFAKPSNPKAKACSLDCNSPKCEAVCRGRKPKCNGLGSGCYDPRFVGGDGAVFYFHGRKDEHFALVSDTGFHVNARFIGIRPANRTRDFTWIQALGLILGGSGGGSHTLAVEAARAAKWEDGVDRLRLSYDGEPLDLPEGHLARWEPTDDDNLAVERTGSRNSILVSVRDAVEVSVSVVPITEEEDRVHGYGVPGGDCFAHLEVQFRFPGRLSPRVEGVLGRTYRPDYVSAAKPGVAMPVAGGEDRYRTSSLLSPDCKACLFSQGLQEDQ